jgi:hypothetical protein
MDEDLLENESTNIDDNEDLLEELDFEKNNILDFPEEDD